MSGFIGNGKATSWSRWPWLTEQGINDLRYGTLATAGGSIVSSKLVSQIPIEVDIIIIFGSGKRVREYGKLVHWWWQYKCLKATYLENYS